VRGSSAPALPSAAASADPLPDTRAKPRAGDESLWSAPGIHYMMPHGESGESEGGSRPQDAASSRAWLGWRQWDWDARAWGAEREDGVGEPSAERAPSDHDQDLTVEALRQLVTNEKLMIAVRHALLCACGSCLAGSRLVLAVSNVRVLCESELNVSLAYSVSPCVALACAMSLGGDC